MKMEDCMFFRAVGRTVLNRTAHPMESFVTAQGRVWRISGGLVYWGAMLCGCKPEMQQVACAVTVVAIRLLAVRYNWRIPVIENK